MVGKFLSKIGESKKGAAAVLGLGGPLAAGALMWDVVPHDSPEAKGAVLAMTALLAVVGALVGPKVAERVAALLNASKGGAPTGGAK
jgi:hypothetical protein